MPRARKSRQLVDAVHGHARTLTLLAPELRSRGVEATRESLVELMAAMEKRFPGSREKSVFASVELPSPVAAGAVGGPRAQTGRNGFGAATRGRRSGRALALGISRRRRIWACSD
jgi:hypothetical protein